MDYYGGEDDKPTKSELDEYVSKGNILIVWSFALDNEKKKFER